MKAVCVVLACFAVAAFAVPVQSGTKNIVQTAESVPALSTLVAALQAGNLVNALEGPGPFTVFAPTNAAFSKLPAGTLPFLLKPANQKALDNILLYHVVDGAAVYSSQLSNLEKATTMQGQNVTVFLDFASVYINFAQVVIANVTCSNGVVHVIDTVLIPAASSSVRLPTPLLPNIVQLAQSVPDLSTLVTAVVAAGLVSVLEGSGPFTVFAPTNEAFAALPAGVLNFLLQPANIKVLQSVLTYHVVGGAAVLSSQLSDRETFNTVQGGPIEIFFNFAEIFVNFAQVTAPNNLASNGVVHIIDAVIPPPGIASWESLLSN
jgi:uncharacterized surface protein with fasciclin (FAS1) repeats